MSVLDNGIGNDDRTLDVRANCPTGNCTFPIFNTLAMCSRCADITNDIKYIRTTNQLFPPSNLSRAIYQRNIIEYKVPGGVSMYQWVDMGNQNQTLNMTFTVTWATPHDLDSLGPDYGLAMPMSLSILRFPYHPDGNDATEQRPTGAQCALFPCVKTLAVSVVEGRQKVKPLATWMNVTSLQDLSNNKDGYILRPPPPSNLTVPPGSLPPQLLDNFQINHDAKDFFTRLMWHYFNGSYTLADQALVSEEAFRIPSDRGPLAGRGPFYINGTDDIPLMMEHVADSLTTFFRREAEANSTDSLIDGTAYKTFTFVSIRWAWLTFPVFMLAATALMLPITVIVTSAKKAPLWKDSTLPLLFHGIQESALPPEFQGPKETALAMMNISRDLKVDLRHDDDGQLRLSSRKAMNHLYPQPTDYGDAHPGKPWVPPGGW
jgi:hypothetical protein